MTEAAQKGGKTMKTWNVAIFSSGRIDVSVLAETEAEALDLAAELVPDYDKLYECEMEAWQVGE